MNYNFNIMISDLDPLKCNVTRFQTSVLTINLPETAQPGERIAIPTAKDADSSKFGVHRYGLATPSNAFRLEVTSKTKEPSFVLTRNVDREKEEALNVTIVAYDGGEPARFSTLLVIVRIDDVNDNKPEFESQAYDVDILENVCDPTTPLLTVRATDKDSGANGQVIITMIIIIIYYHDYYHYYFSVQLLKLSGSHDCFHILPTLCFR